MAKPHPITPEGSLVMPASSRGAGLLFLALLAGCSDTPTPDALPGWAGTVDSLADGTIVVSNPAEGLWGPGEEGQVVEERRVGRVEGGGPDTFGEVGFLELDELGRIWVFDNQVQAIRVFDADGSYVRTVGGRGEGPGEFQWVSGMSWGPEGRLWVLDVGTMRFSVFDTVGVLQNSHRVEGGSMIFPWPGGFDGRGRLHHYARRPAVDGQGFELVLVRYDTLMTPGDTVLIPSLPSPEIFELRGETSYMSVGVPFTSRGQWRLTPEGEILLSDAHAYRFALLGPSGDTLRIISRHFEAVPVRETDIDAGRVWVLPWEAGEGEDARLHLFDREGRYQGKVRLPSPVETNPAPVVREDTFVALTLDELGVAYVIRGRVQPPISYSFGGSAPSR